MKAVCGNCEWWEQQPGLRYGTCFGGPPPSNGQRPITLIDTRRCAVWRLAERICQQPPDEAAG